VERPLYYLNKNWHKYMAIPQNENGMKIHWTDEKYDCTSGLVVRNHAKMTVKCPIMLLLIHAPPRLFSS
jgi:hypothetical protein